MLKRKQLFGANIDPSCSYCRYGNLTQDKTMVLCEKRGVVSPYSSCKKFTYAPLKRIPRRPKPLDSYDESDFKL